MSKPAIFNYTHYPGFFVQDGTTGGDIPAAPPSFGLLDQSPDRWSKFWKSIAQLNNDGKAQGFEYKVFFVGRHGLGVHNVAMIKYPGATTKPSDKDWYTYWSNRHTDGILTWGPDPVLAYDGYCGAAAVNSVWVKELQAGIGLPQTIYCSPLTRTLCTHTLTFNGLDGYDPKNNVVVEDLREWCGTQTPELRRSKTYIQEMFPSFSIEPGFSEDDPIWDPVFPETGTDLQNRIITVLNEVFSHHDGPFVSLTTHGAFSDGLCRVIGRSVYGLKPAGVLPIVIRKSAVDAIPKDPIQPGTYTIRSVSNPDHIMCLANANDQSAIPDDSVIALEAIYATCNWDVSAASDGHHYIRVHDPSLHLSIRKSPRGDFAAHVDDSTDEPEPEYAIESDGMGRFRIISPSTGLVYTYIGHRKQVRLAHEVVDNDAHKWYFDAV